MTMTHRDKVIYKFFLENFKSTSEDEPTLRKLAVKLRKILEMEGDKEYD